MIHIWFVPLSALSLAAYRVAPTGMEHRIAAAFDWRLFDPVICVRAVSGLIVIDGQHRCTALRQLGYDGTVPTVIGPDLRQRKIEQLPQ